MEWISVKDRLPEVESAEEDESPDLKTSEPFLVVDIFGSIFVAQYETNISPVQKLEYGYWRLSGTKYRVFDVTHWGKLPELHK